MVEVLSPSPCFSLQMDLDERNLVNTDRVGLQRDGLFHRRRQVRVYRAKNIDDFSIDRDEIGIFEPDGRVTRRYRHRVERGHHGYVFEIWIDDGVVDADSVRASERRDFGWGFLEREE